jgi:hypothetical protein
MGLEEKQSNVVAKQRMGDERGGEVPFVSQNFRRFVDIFPSAIITLRRKPTINGRSRPNSVSLAKRNVMGMEQILSTMNPLVFAGNHPAITAVFPGCVTRFLLRTDLRERFATGKRSLSVLNESSLGLFSVDSLSAAHGSGFNAITLLPNAVLP